MLKDIATMPGDIIAVAHLELFHDLDLAATALDIWLFCTFSGGSDRPREKI